MIAFRKLERADLPRLLELKEESFGSTHHVTIANMEDQERWFDSLDQHVHSPRSLCLIASTDEFPKFGILKITNVDWISRSADLAWDVFKEHRGNGLGKALVSDGVKYCLEVLNLRRLTAEILDHNIASQKCAIHAGFIHEGTKRQAIHKEGCYADSLIFGILA